MKRILSLCSLVVGLLGSSAVSGWSESLPVWIGGASLEVDDVYEATGNPILLHVTYHAPVDQETLGDDDLWVVSRNGYNAMASLIAIDTQTKGDPDAPFEDGVGADGEFIGEWVEATYAVAPPTDGGWREAENGRFVVLLEPGAVELAYGGVMPPSLLGAFQVAVGEPRPLVPSHVGVSVEMNADGVWQAVVDYRFPRGPVDVVSWGEASGVEGEWHLAFQGAYAEGASLETPATLQRVYPLGVLEPGFYGLTVSVNGTDAGWDRFRVPGAHDPIEAEIGLRVKATDDGRQVAYSVIQFADPFYVLTDDGEVSRQDRTYFIDVSAQTVVFVREPEASRFELKHDLGKPDPGKYALVYRINGQVIETFGFVVGDDGGGSELPAAVDLSIVREEDKVFGNVRVAIDLTADGSAYEIVDWGEPVLSGQTFTVNAQALPTAETDALRTVQEHAYCLVGEDSNNGEGRPIDFETVELIPSFLRPLEPEQWVFRSEAEWERWLSDRWPPEVDALPVEVPVDFEAYTLVAVFAGETDQGVDTYIEEITDYGSYLFVRYVNTLPGILPEDVERVRPVQMVAIPKTDLPVRFEGDVIAFPTPLPVDPFPGEPAGPPEDLAFAGQKVAPGIYTMVFQINGVIYARASFEIEGEALPIPAKAQIEVEVDDHRSAVAAVEVAFTGAPYHSVMDWGEVRRDGNRFILEATASEITFVREPDLPYYERHRYALTLSNTVEPIDFREVDLSLQRERPANVVIRSREEWWRFIGFEPGPLVLPGPDPVDFEEETLVMVFSGAQPNGCYGVRIEDIEAVNGIITVSYRQRVPGLNEFCTEAIVYPLAAVAIPRTTAEVDFVQLPEQVGPGVMIPVDGGPGDGSGAEPFPNLAGSEDAAARGPIFEVEFRLNGVTYAQTTFRGSDVVILDPDPAPTDSEDKGVDRLRTPFLNWLEGFRPPQGGAGAGEFLPDDASWKEVNADGDRWSDFEEFLLGLDPIRGGQAGLWTDWVQDSDGETRFAICFHRRKDADGAVSFDVEVSKDLETWIHDPTLTDVPLVRDLDADLEEVTICLSPEAILQGFPFARLNLVEK